MRRGQCRLRKNLREILFAERMLRRKTGGAQIDQHGRLRVMQNLRGAVCRIRRIDRNIAAPGLERAEHAGGNGRLLVAVDHDRPAVAWQRAAKVRRKRIRHAVQRGKAYLLIMIADRNAVRFCIVLQSFQNKHAYVSSIIRCVPLVRQRHARVVGHKIIARVFRKMSAVQRVKPACRPVHDRAYPRMVNRLWSVRTQERALHDLCFAAHAP